MKYQAIREEIKKFAQQQKELKPQRKTVNFNGKRKISSAEDTFKVLDNKYILRHLYVAYAIIKGVIRPEITDLNKELSARMIDNLVKIFTPKETKDTAV